MTNANGDKSRNERFLDALVEELRTMNETDALEGENAEELVKLGERLLKGARDEAGKLRMAAAKRKLSLVSQQAAPTAALSVADARRYLASLPEATLAARKLDELSDADLLDLYNQARSLEGEPDSGGEDANE